MSLKEIIVGLIALLTLLLVLFNNSGYRRKLAWMVIIIFLPIAGSLLFLLFGLNLRSVKMYMQKHKPLIDKLQELDPAGLSPDGPDESLVNEAYRPLVRLLSQDINNLSAGNSFEVIIDGRVKQEMLMEDIRNAKEYIHIEYFHFGMDKGSRVIKRLLEKKAEEGVKVRFLNENIANLPNPLSYYRSMEKSGVDVENFTSYKMHLIEFITSLNHRNHRKIVVIDGKVGYTGGMNINDNYFRRWRDTHMRLSGPAVGALNALFLDSWLTSGGTIDKPLLYYLQTDTRSRDISSPYYFKDKVVQVVPDDPYALSPVIQHGYEWIFHNIRKYIYIQTPYFAPPEAMLSAMKAAAERGVEVVLMLPLRADNLLMVHTNRAYYEECLAAGIRIFLRKGEFIHSKTFVCDDYLSQIGAANLDMRSLDLSYEVNTYIYDTEVALACKEIFFKDLAQCEELDLQKWKKRPFPLRIIESVFKLFTPLL